MTEYYYGNGRSNKVSGQEDKASAKQALLMPTSADSKRKHAADSSLATQQRRRTGEDSHTYFVDQTFTSFSVAAIKNKTMKTQNTTSLVQCHTTN